MENDHPPFGTPPGVNIVRFPVERRARATLERMRELAPDVADVLAIIRAFALDGPSPDLRERADAGMAARIADGGPDGDPVPPTSLNQLLDPLVIASIAACWSARDSVAATAEAEEILLRGRQMGHEGLGWLRGRVRDLRRRTAELLVEAHARTEEAEGVARAVGFARHGEPWTPPAADAKPVVVPASPVGSADDRAAGRRRGPRGKRQG